MRWFSRTPRDEPRHDGGADACLARARDLLLTKGPAAALEYLGTSSHAADPAVQRMLWAVAWNHQARIEPPLLREPYLDSIYCQCSVCESTWILSPLAAEGGGVSAGQPFPVTCPKCKRVLCAQCVQASGRTCTCGASYVPLTAPNGRQRRKAGDAASDFDWWEPPPDRPVETDPTLHLYFGPDGRVPVGIDPAFPKVRTADAASHLAWTEQLLDVELAYHASLQFDLVEEPAGAPREHAQWLWLRARLAMVRYRNAYVSHQRREDDVLMDDEWEGLPAQIVEWLERAVRENPKHGAAWLTAAEVHLDPRFARNAERAIECARAARAALGDTADVRYALGRALRASGRAEEATAILDPPPDEHARLDDWRRELLLARLEHRCAARPIDVEAHWLLARWYQRHSDHRAAGPLVARLMEERPDRAEGYCGSAFLSFFADDLTPAQRNESAYRLCQEALARDPNLGAAYEVFGTIYSRNRYRDLAGDIPPGDALECYRRAIALDSSCDAALDAVAADHMEHGRAGDALALLEKAVAADTADESVYFHLVIIYQAQREWEKMEWAERKARELAPGVGLSSDYKVRMLRRLEFEY